VVRPEKTVGGSRKNHTDPNLSTGTGGQNL
jgi:hypothetical protein